MCLRFIAICRLLHEQEDRDSTVGWSPHSIDPTPTSTSTHTSIASPSDVIFPTRASTLRAATRDNNNNNNNNNNNSSNQRGSVVPVIIPPEEIQGLRKEFFTQVMSRQHTLSTHPITNLSINNQYHTPFLSPLFITTHHYSNSHPLSPSDLLFVSNHALTIIVTTH